MGIREILTDIWCGNLKERNHLESLGTDEMVVLKYSKEYDWSEWEENKLRALADTVAKFRVSENSALLLTGLSKRTLVHGII
jgi:hypothetical protein